jgi:cation:H+ antiporter
MDFLVNFLLLGLSLSILIWGADKFIDNSSIIAKKLGINELTIGLTVVALGTSAPEIFVGISSIINSTEVLAMGAVVGSNISNIALIFGVSCIGITLKPHKTKFIQFIPFLLSALLLGYALYDLKISSIESILMLIVFIYFLFVIFKNKSSEVLTSNILPSGGNSIYLSAMLFIGLIALIVGSNYAVIYAEKIAILLNIPEVIIGLTIIAIGTSLPELAATISAVLKNKTDMVVGNVIGSNVLNITLVVPIIGLFSNAQLDQMLFERDYLIMIVLSILFTIFAIRFMNTASINFIRLIGFLLVFGYIGYILRLSGLV